MPSRCKVDILYIIKVSALLLYDTCPGLSYTWNMIAKLTLLARTALTQRGLSHSENKAQRNPPLLFNPGTTLGVKAVRANRPGDGLGLGRK